MCGRVNRRKEVRETLKIRFKSLKLLVCVVKLLFLFKRRTGVRCGMTSLPNLIVCDLERELEDPSRKRVTTTLAAAFAPTSDRS